MESAIKVRKVTQDVLKFVWFKHGILSNEPSPDLRFIPDITSEFMSNLKIAVWMQSFRNDYKWKGFFRKHFNTMTFSAELFAKYVSYACCTLNPDTTNVYASFFDALSLVSYFVLRCWEEGFEEFLNTSVDLFCAFFKKELRIKFEDQGGWEDFNEYLEKHFDLVKYKSMIDDDIWPFEYFKQPEDKIEEDVKLSYGLQYIRHERVTEREVETNEKAVSFSEAVTGKLEDLCQQTFEEMLTDFAKTDSLVEELYRQTVGEASGGLTKEVEHISSRKVQEVSENIPIETKSEKELVKPIVTISDSQNSDNINFPKVAVPNKAPHFIPKKEIARKLLGDISKEISNLSELIQFLCKEHGVQVPVLM